MKIINLTPQSEAWHAWRRKGIGASDIGAIMGVCPYRSRFDIMKDKFGLSEPTFNSRMQKGIEFEPEARDAFEARHPGMKYPALMIEHDEVSHWHASLDGYCQFTRDGLEIKIPGQKTMDMARYGQIPLHYQYQMQWQMIVSGGYRTWYFVYNPDTLEQYALECYSDEEIQKKLIDAANKFWDDFLEGKIDEPANTKKIDRSILLWEIGNNKEVIKELERKNESMQKELLEKYGTDQSLEDEDFIFKRCERSNFDYKLAILENGIDVKQYKKPNTVFWTIKSKK
jgi:putative phage-type endonuclease